MFDCSSAAVVIHFILLVPSVPRVSRDEVGAPVDRVFRLELRRVATSATGLASGLTITEWKHHAAGLVTVAKFDHWRLGAAPILGEAAA